MPARPRIPDPQEGALQAFAYDLRELGEGKASVAWIAEHEETTVSRAALYAALSGTRLPKAETVSTLLRWWAGDPTIEEPDEDDYLIEPTWAWINRLPFGDEKRRFAEDWRTRYQRLARGILDQREFRPRAAQVAIDVPPEQERFIRELNDLIGKTGLEDELWLLLGAHTPRAERYLAGESIPTDDTCWVLAHRLAEFIPDSYVEDLAVRLVRSAEVARLARVRDRRIAREGRGRGTVAATE
uniref:Uncharacterized protein n=1 Tax=Streptomyces sp. F11 TaxID=319318 RepID=Q58IP3_9ACTN|nr:hypothetical protein [Streptomyces sp. F11]AAX51340.1 unknown [Streptomyces sp. F11]